MTIQSGCTQSTQYTQQETACLIANNEEYFSQFNIKTYALETKQKKQFSSYSKDEQNLKVSVQKKPCDNLNNAKCVQIDGRKHIKDLVDESYHVTQNWIKYLLINCISLIQDGQIVMTNDVMITSYSWLTSVQVFQNRERPSRDKIC